MKVALMEDARSRGKPGYPDDLRPLTKVFIAVLC